MYALWSDLKSRVTTLAAQARQTLHRTLAQIRRHTTPLTAWLLPRLTRHRRVCAVTFSVAVHLLLILCFLLPPPASFGLSGGGAIGNGSGVGDGEHVEMFDGRLPQNLALTVKPQEAEDSEDLTTTELAAVDDLSLDTPQVSDLAPSLSDISPEKSVPKSQAAADSAANMGATGTGGLTAGDGDDLWAAIAPCWKKVADDSTLPVTLDVTFGADGGLALPPVIERDPTAALDSQVLVSESRAIQALAACGVYPMASGRANVKIEFPRM